MSSLDLGTFITPVPPILNTMEMYAVFDRFRSNKEYSFFPVVDDAGKPLGILRELELRDYAYGPFGRELIKRQSVAKFVQPCMMMEDTIPVEEMFLRLGRRTTGEGLIITHNESYRGVILNLSLLAIYEEFRQRIQRQLSQVQKMEAIGTLAGGIAHDFNNILMPIIGYADMLKRALVSHSDQLAVYADQILLAANRARELVSQILAFSRQKSRERIPIGLSSIIKEVMKLLRSSLPSTIEIITQIQADNDVVVADPTEIHQVLMNLCTNAAHAMKERGGVLTVSLNNHQGPPAGWSGGAELQLCDYLHLAVGDTGCGIPRHLYSRIFDPFFTTKKPGEGTGMGLAMVHGIVKSCGGLATFESEVDIGTTFHVYLPLSQRTTDTSSQQLGESRISGAGRRVLFVDDEVMITEIAQEALEEMGFRVVAKTSSPEALALFQTTPGDFDVIVTDQTMPELTGLNFARFALDIRPDIPIILATGYSEQVSAEMAKAIGIREYVMKPINFTDMAALIVAVTKPA